ncbi:MAG: hypothetical protein OXB95_00920, partial [Rhodobacteraceae bacterium]|nr:hypothetical protein [Paracoccaceae bacterium]
MNQRSTQLQRQVGARQGIPGAFVDASVLVADPNVIMRLQDKTFPVISTTLCQELEATTERGSNKPQSENAAKIRKFLDREEPSSVAMLPNGMTPRNNDKFLRFDLGQAALYQIERKSPQRSMSWQERNFPIARDYKLGLLTRDESQHRAAAQAGVKSVVWQGKRESSNTRDTTSKGIPSKRFRLPASVSVVKDTPIPVTSVPGFEEMVRPSRSGVAVRLGNAVGAGGEGTVFLTSIPGKVAKIYRRERITRWRHEKLKRMVEAKVDCKGICWPEELLTNSQGEFVGFLMPHAHGHPLQKSVFVSPLLRKKFPDWTRRNLVNLCIGVLERIDYLHRMNVIIGDINPLNILAHGDGSAPYFVDVDSFQIEEFPCPVGTINFSAPEIQHWDSYSAHLRTKEHELFAVATMMFMILLPGKPPYSQQGGESQRKNIQQGNFPYPYPYGGQGSGQTLPSGPWRYIWSHLPNPVQKEFHGSFQKRNRCSVADWLKVMEGYKQLIDSGYASDEIFPRDFALSRSEQV